MPADTAAWSGFSPRPETTPGLLASPAAPGYTLEIHGNGVPNVYGGWTTRIHGVVGGSHYRVRARAVPTSVSRPRESITILLWWRGAVGGDVAPHYVWDYRLQSDGSLAFDRIVQAPPGATGVDVQLVLQWEPAASVRFDGLSFQRSVAPAPRPVTLAAVYFRPSGTSSGLDSVQQAARFGEQVAASHRPDVIVFGEMLNVIGAPGTYDAKAETIPGPSTDAMAGFARAYGVNVVFGMLERVNGFLFNTAVLLDRSGNVVGKQRKVQLPLEDVSAGITPGDSVQVFDTDVGRVALLICQDTAFPEPAREAALKGAEMLLVPIWGGKAALVHARAIEQSMYVVASGYDYASEIVDPLGTVLDRVQTLAQAGAAVATIDLSHRFREPWIGDWRDTSGKQRRTLPYTADATNPPGTPPPTPPPDVTPPAVSLTAPTAGAAVSGIVSVSAHATDNVGVSAVQFLLDGSPLGADDTTPPYAVSWDTRTAANGVHTLTAAASDAAGNTSSSTVTVTVANTATRMRIEAEDFDDGGANISYYDTTAGNRYGAYRNTDVDIEPTTDTGGGYNVAKIRTHEWLNYTVDIPTSGTYVLSVRVASLGPGGWFHIESGGVNVSGSLRVPDTGGWQNWTTVTAPVTLGAGQQTLRFVVEAESSIAVFGNVNWFELQRQ